MVSSFCNYECIFFVIIFYTNFISHLYLILLLNYRFNSEKGFGFISIPGSDDCFVHYSAIKTTKNEFASLQEGESVSLELTQSAKGMQAKDVERLD